MRIFVGSLLLIFLIAARPAARLVCADLQYVLTVFDTTDGLNNGRIEVKITKSSSRVKAYLYSKKGNQRQNRKEGAELNTLINLAPGHYILVLQNRSCSVVEKDIHIK